MYHIWIDVFKNLQHYFLLYNKAMFVEYQPGVWFGPIEELQDFRHIQKNYNPAYLYVFVYGARRWATLYPWNHGLDQEFAKCPYTLVDTSCETFDMNKIVAVASRNIIVLADQESYHLFSGVDVS